VIKQGTLLHVAAYCGAVDCLKFLIEKKAELDKRDEVSPKVNLFFSFECRPFSCYRTPLYMACISGNVQVVQELINAGADPSAPVLLVFMIDTFIFFALRSSSIFWFPIHRAALWSHIDVMKVLIASNVDVNAEDEDGVFLFFIGDQFIWLQNGIILKQLKFL
jgi:ankyrin repeat protein